MTQLLMFGEQLKSINQTITRFFARHFGRLDLHSRQRNMECIAMKSKLTETVQVRITPEELAQISAKAASEDRSISNCLRQLVKAGMSAAGSERQQAA
jgi:hypothetical protein